MDNYQVPQNPIYNQPVTQPITQSTAPAQSSGMPSASAVNIVIQNPTANAAPNYPCYPANYYMQQPVYNMLPNNAYPQAAPIAPQAPSVPVAAAPIEKEETKTEEKEEKKSGKTKKVVQLTDEYIKTLENYLRNPNKDIRVMGAKELTKRFTEDDSRRNDRALNSLLNLLLQDKASDVRALGLAITTAGLAQGDDNTVKILQNMQSSDAAYGQDALMATNALLKMAGNVVKVPDDSPDKTESQEKAAKERRKEAREAAADAEQAEADKKAAKKQAEEAAAAKSK